MPSGNASRGETTNESTNTECLPVEQRRGRPSRGGIEPRQVHALALLVSGKSQREVAEQLEVNEKTIARWLREPAVKLEFAHQAAAVSTELWAQLAAVTDEVWTIFRRLLHSQDERIQLRAATWYLDRLLSLTSIERVLEDGPQAMPALPASLLRRVGELPDENQGDAL